MKRICFGLAAVLFLSHPALAANDPKALGVFGDWKAYAFTDKDNKVCFMSAKPTEQKGKFKKRGDALLFVTHWPSEKTKNVVSVAAGYAYRGGTDAVIEVDGKKFKMTTESETAWSSTQGDDDAIVEAIRKGAGLKVEGVSKRGTKTTDIYDLKGSAAAYDAISKECSF